MLNKEPGSSPDIWFAAVLERIRVRIERRHPQFRANRICGGRTSEDLAEDALTRAWFQREVLRAWERAAWHAAQRDAQNAIAMQKRHDAAHEEFRRRYA